MTTAAFPARGTDPWSAPGGWRPGPLPGPHASIICVTAAHRVVERAAQIQADAAIPKPFDLDRLLELVARLLPPPPPGAPGDASPAPTRRPS